MNRKLIEDIDKKKQEFFFNGFLEIEIKKTLFLKDLLTKLEIYYSNDKSQLDEFKQSYTNTFDLNADSNFLDEIVKFAINENIPQIVNKITGLDYVLGDVVLRKSYNNVSYMPWHRDTYLDKDKNLVGRIPPLVKVIFFPQFDEKASHEFSILEGSSRRVFKNYFIDKLQKFFWKEKKIFQSNEKFIVFDSSCIHQAEPCDNLNGSFRLIYNFCEKSQIGSFKGRGRVNKIYNKYLR